MLRVLLLLLSFTLMTGIVAGDEPRARVGSQSTQRFDPDELLAEDGPLNLPPIEAQPAPRTSRHEPIPLTRDSESGSTKDGSRSSNAGLAMSTLFTALTVVVLLMLGLAKVFSKRNPFLAPGIPREAVDVLGRRTVDPRSSIYVVRVGAKVLLLGSSSNGLTSLSEITDPIEVATLTSLCRGVETDRPTFGVWLLGLLGRKVQRDPRTFGERFGESLFQDAELNGQPISSLTVRPSREGQHVA